MYSHTLSDLPLEILDLIFSYLCPHCAEQPEATPCNSTVHTRDTLLALCLVCTRLRPSAQAILFHEYHVAYRSTGGAESSSEGPLVSFLKAVTRRPYLANQVKRVCISSSQLRSIGCNDARSMLEEAALARGTTLSKAWAPRMLDISNELPESRQFLASFLQGWDSIGELQTPSQQQRRWLNTELASMVIALLPKLEHVGLETGAFPLEANLMPSLQAFGATNLPIRSVGLYSWQSPSALAFLRLASRLEILHVHKYTVSLPALALPTFTTLRLTECRYSEQDLGKLLGKCTNLETFVYESSWADQYGCAPDMSGSDHFQPTDAVVHLRRQRRMLRNLHLDLRKRGSFPNPGGTIQPISSLEEFGALQHLFSATGSPTLAEERLASFLPRTIVSLHLADLNGNAPTQAAALAGLADAVAEGAFPCLKVVRCDESPRFSESLEERLTAAGVDLGYASWPVEPPPPYFYEPGFYPHYAMPLPDSEDEDL
ncbi:F-box domain protein [Aspergillus clavatus NRRL 1]|uniref:F-box domain protein n=1 Tax=Aspergillus clavatus (strain ATCC 1007 / CBS 513.65 / DSM 816 / NCTC 3887 / NRRL 1 / QM 1276 / 107) TaxID=344612 RepID=A1CAW0_ASPCL|nr:F-box domain protein [Aspergillus clavatus NRRL 1]EAW12878.1 F-box domain protein [Aspergillus clavatus NRRL 1]